MIPPKKVTYVTMSPKVTSSTIARPDNLQRMRDRLAAIKGLAKQTAFRPATNE